MLRSCHLDGRADFRLLAWVVVTSCIKVRFDPLQIHCTAGLRLTNLTSPRNPLLHQPKSQSSKFALDPTSRRQFVCYHSRLSKVVRTGAGSVSHLFRRDRAAVSADWVVNGWWRVSVL